MLTDLAFDEHSKLDFLMKNKITYLFFLVRKIPELKSPLCIF